MTMIPLPQRPSTATVYARFTTVTEALAGRDPEEDLETFGEFLLLRDHLFERLGLPVTAHNSLRLYDCAEGALPIEAFLSDTDHFFPASVLADEGLLLSALAIYFSWRDVTDHDSRIYDVLAFLGVPFHSHNVAAITGWLECSVSYSMLRAVISDDEVLLNAAVC